MANLSGASFCEVTSHELSFPTPTVVFGEICPDGR